MRRGAQLYGLLHCNPEVDKLINQQSIETDQVKRKQLVWEIDARPVIFYPRGAVCRQPQLKGFSLMVNSIYNGRASKTSGSTRDGGRRSVPAGR